MNKVLLTGPSVVSGGGVARSNTPGGGGGPNSGQPVQPQPAQPPPPVNLSVVCRIGQETVQEIQSRTHGVFCYLKQLQVRNCLFIFRGENEGEIIWFHHPYSFKFGFVTTSVRVELDTTKSHTYRFSKSNCIFFFFSFSSLFIVFI